MAQRAGYKAKFLYSLLFLSLLFRSFTGAPEAQTNFMGLIQDGASWTHMTESVDSQTLGLFGPTLESHKSASSTPPKSAEYKLYKKYLPPDKGFHVQEYVTHKAEQLFISIQITSYYIKDLTLRSLHSNSPPAPVSTLLFIALLYLFIKRIGVFGNYGEVKNNGDWRFSLQ